MGVYIDKNDFKQLEQNNLLFSTVGGKIKCNHRKIK